MSELPLYTTIPFVGQVTKPLPEGTRFHEGHYRRINNRTQNELGAVLAEFRRNLYRGEYDEDIRDGKQLMIAVSIAPAEFLRTDG